MPSTSPRLTVPLRWFAALGLVIVLAVPSDARADEPPHRFGVDLALAPSYSDSSLGGSSLTFETLGLHFHHRLSSTWGYEVAVLTGDYFGPSADTYVDLSARWTITESERFELFALGGAGVLFYDVPTERDDMGFPDESSGTTRESPTLHLGLAGILDITERYYFRFDLRYHRIDEIERLGGYGLEEDDWNGSIGFGVSF